MQSALGLQDRLLLNAGQKYCRMPQSFTVTKKPILAASSCTHMRFCVHVGTLMKSYSVKTQTAMKVLALLKSDALGCLNDLGVCILIPEYLFLQ